MGHEVTTQPARCCLGPCPAVCFAACRGGCLVVQRMRAPPAPIRLTSHPSPLLCPPPTHTPLLLCPQIKVLVDHQSPDIAQGVHGMGHKPAEEIGAGDQVRDTVPKCVWGWGVALWREEVARCCSSA